MQNTENADVPSNLEMQIHVPFQEMLNLSLIVYFLLYPTNNAEKIILVRKSLTVNDFYRPRYEVVSIDGIFYIGCFNSTITGYGQGFSEVLAPNAVAMDFMSKKNMDSRKGAGLSLNLGIHCRTKVNIASDCKRGCEVNQC